MKSLIIMNPDGSAGVSADIRFGSKIPILGWMPYPMILLGAILLAGGWMLVRRKKDASPRDGR
jgi:LPXTG-motif cell wall-anchored protein